MSKKKSMKARFDAKLSIQQKKLFEKATILGGYRNLSDFIITVAQEKAKEIISKHELIIASEEDSKIFFDALLNPKKPSKSLIDSTNSLTS